MDKKKKFRIVVMIPAIVSVLVAGLAVYFVLQVGASSGHKGVVYSPEMAQVADPAHMTVASSEAGSEGENGDAPVSSEAECSYSEWVGHAVDEGSVKATGRPYRILKPDSMATMDYSPDRINVIVDDHNVVTAVRCG